MSTSQHAVARLNGTEIYYEIAGSGIPLVLIHALSFDIRMWDDQFERFSKSNKVIRYDVRGFGRSADPTYEPFSPAADLAALLDHLEIEQCSLVGLSMGGQIALEFALEYQGRVCSLVVADAPITGFNYPSLLPSLVKTARESGLDAAKKKWLEGPFFQNALSIPRVRTRIERMVSEYRGWQWMNDLSLLLANPAVNDRLHEIRAPALIVVGEHDVEHFHLMADRMEEEMQNARKAVIEGAGHMCNMEKPESFNSLVLEFLPK